MVKDEGLRRQTLSFSAWLDSFCSLFIAEVKADKNNSGAVETTEPPGDCLGGGFWNASRWGMNVDKQLWCYNTKLSWGWWNERRELRRVILVFSLERSSCRTKVEYWKHLKWQTNLLENVVTPVAAETKNKADRKETCPHRGIRKMLDMPMLMNWEERQRC